MIETIIGIIGIILTIRVPVFGFIYNRRKKLEHQLFQSQKTRTKFISGFNLRI